MFLHLGGDTLVRLRDIVGIFDLGTVRRSHDTSDFLELATSDKRLVPPAEGTAKTFLIVDDKVHLSSISSLTLVKRALASRFRPTDS